MNEHAPKLIRDADAARNLEILLISAIVAILVTRIYLQLTGFPQIGGGHLHIAHMLFGGMLMLSALALLVTYLNLFIRVTASVVGGIGFGLFIDELGKFITADNDYFFQPTFSLLYVLFVALFLIVRSLSWAAPLTSYERSVNQDLRQQHLLTADTQPRFIQWYLTTLQHVRGWYLTVVERSRFRTLMIAVIVLIGVGHGIAAVTSFVTQGRQAGIVDNLYLASSAVSGLFLVLGILRLKFNRLHALRLFRMGILVSLAVTQVFLFYVNELSAVGGLFVDLTAYIILNAMIGIERDQ